MAALPLCKPVKIEIDLPRTAPISLPWRRPSRLGCPPPENFPRIASQVKMIASARNRATHGSDSYPGGLTSHLLRPCRLALERM